MKYESPAARPSGSSAWWFRFDCAAWIGSTVTLTAEECGVMIRCMAWAWLNGGIPDSDRAITSICGASAAVARRVLADKWRLVDGHWRNPRLEAERARASGRTVAAQASAAARWDADAMRSHEECNADAMQSHCDRNASKSKSKSKSQRESTDRQDGSLASLARPMKITYDGSAFTDIDPSEVDRWRLAYPAVAVDGEILRAAAWLAANPKKTKSNYSRFLAAWLSRCQDRGGSVGSTVRSRFTAPIESNF